MSERPRLFGGTSADIGRMATVFVAGIALGALMMVEIVPAASHVDLADVATQPGDTGSTPREDAPGDTTDADTEATSGQADRDVSVAGPDALGDEPDDGRTAPPGSSPNDPPDRQPLPPTTPGIECAPGRNGGATDQGVTGDGIKLATTVVESGVGSSFLGEVRFAMEAVKDRVNRAGGICGRQLNITYRDDGWEASTGSRFLRSFIDDVFAIPVGPSSEGLNAVIASGDFDKAQIPVVGTDGLIETQYETTDGKAQQWVWPVAVATVSSARIMAKDAHDRAVRMFGKENVTSDDFSIVFEWDYNFGAEGAEAFNDEVKRLTGGNVPGYSQNKQSCTTTGSERNRFCAIRSGQSNYGSQVQAFEPGKFVALFLEPDTAQKWMTNSNSPAASDTSIPLGFGAAQPLFTQGFAEGCKDQCDGMLVWTGFKPNQEHYRSDPAVQTYVHELRNANSQADPNNQFSLGAYIGMELLVEAIRKVGPELTRVKLKQVLDNITLDSGLTLTEPLRFRPDSRYIATTMQAWEIQHPNLFAGWSAKQIVNDPRFGG